MLIYHYLPSLILHKHSRPLSISVYQKEELCNVERGREEGACLGAGVERGPFGANMKKTLDLLL